MQDIFALPIEELQDLFVAAGLKKFRAKQVFQWLYQKSVFDFAAMHNLSKADIAAQSENFARAEFLRRHDEQAALGLAGRKFGRNGSDAP